MPNIDAERSKLGENADARLDAVNSWASSFFSAEEYEAIANTLGATAEGIEAKNFGKDVEQKQIQQVNEVDNTKQQTKTLGK